MAVVVEICVEGLHSALEAGRGGADRVELCEHLAVGGVTPSAGAIATACRLLSIPVHVLIRPRGGSFVHADAEIEAMRHDIRTARALGAAGVVLGVLDEGGAVDEGRTAELIAEARPMSVTFHRAFDEVPDQAAALDRLIALGVDRILTSGQSESARGGLDRLAGLHRRAAGRIVILPGGRVGAGDVPALGGAGLREVHVGSAACREGRTDAEAVGRIVAAARACDS